MEEKYVKLSKPSVNFWSGNTKEVVDQTILRSFQVELFKLDAAAVSLAYSKEAVYYAYRWSGATALQA